MSRYPWPGCSMRSCCSWSRESSATYGFAMQSRCLDNRLTALHCVECYTWRRTWLSMMNSLRKHGLRADTGPREQLSMMHCASTCKSADSRESLSSLERSTWIPHTTTRLSETSADECRDRHVGLVTRAASGYPIRDYSRKRTCRAHTGRTHADARGSPSGATLRYSVDRAVHEATDATAGIRRRPAGDERL